MGSPTVSVLYEARAWPDDAARFLASLERHRAGRPARRQGGGGRARRLAPPAATPRRAGGGALFCAPPPGGGGGGGPAPHPRPARRAWEAPPEAERRERSRHNMGIVHEVFF